MFELLLYTTLELCTKFKEDKKKYELEFESDLISKRCLWYVHFKSQKGKVHLLHTDDDRDKAGFVLQHGLWSLPLTIKENYLSYILGNGTFKRRKT